MAKDYTKYSVEGVGENLNKRQLVFEIVKDYIQKHTPLLEELNNVFPDHAQGSKGFIRKESEVDDYKRFNMKTPLKIKNGMQIVVSNQWGENIVGFIELAEKLGYSISKNESVKSGNKSKKATGELQEVEIKISGRIPKYFFGRVKEEFQREISEATKYCNKEEIENVQAFINSLLSLTLENSQQELEKFKTNVNQTKLKEHCPNLTELVAEIEETSSGHFRFYELFLDSPNAWAGGSGCITFFEEDAKISITINNEEEISEMLLGDFAETINEWPMDIEDEPTNEEEKNIVKDLKSFKKKNKKEFGLDDAVNASWNEQGVKFCEFYFWPPALADFAEREYSVVICHHDIIDYTFTFETVDFDYKKLLFLSFGNNADFNKSAYKTVANYIFYDNEIIRPEEYWYRDKGITLEYEPSFGSLDFLING